MGKLVTPGEIHRKKFHTHRFTEGYDMEEVNQFLDEVEATVAALAARLVMLEGRRDDGQEG